MDWGLYDRADMLIAELRMAGAEARAIRERCLSDRRRLELERERRKMQAEQLQRLRLRLSTTRLVS